MLVETRSAKEKVVLCLLRLYAVYLETRESKNPNVSAGTFFERSLENYFHESKGKTR